VREAKQRAELGYKQQLERATALDKELAFYQAQSARVMADRDRAVWEGEELKAQNLQVCEWASSQGISGGGKLAHPAAQPARCLYQKQLRLSTNCACTLLKSGVAVGAAHFNAVQLDQQLREASGRAETEGSQRAQAERQLAELRLQLRAAQAKAAEAEALPGLRQELSASGAEVARLLQREQRLEGEGAQLREQLAAAQAANAAATAQAAEQQRTMDDLAASNAVVQQQLREELQGLKVRSGPRVVGAGHH
jgi:hypothetical protein